MRCLQALLLLLFFTHASSQVNELNSHRLLNLKADSIIILSDSLLIDTSSVDIKSHSNSLAFSFESKSNENVYTIICPSCTQYDTISISYRVLLKNLKLVENNRSSKVILDPAKEIYIGSDYNPYKEAESIVDFKKLNYLGSFDRGLSFGNNQSLVLNSNFNMQMAGKIGNGIGLTAAISDNNIPIQPEGNTQNINDFDRVYIALTKGKNTLVAGDYVLNKPPSYFMNYHKKLSGLNFEHATELTKGTISSTFSAAISRGKFARNNLEVTEGNQGPYKLIGNDGAQFIIVQSGSERVWIDDEIMVRGANKDYVIDYNSSVIRFTPTRMITKDSRVIIEFEYVEQSFQRSLIAASTGYETEKLKFGFNFYSEQDAKNVQGDVILSDNDVEILRNAGDSASLALRPGNRLFDPEEDVNRPLYFMQDTIDLNGVSHPIWIHSYDTDKAKYIVQFSDLGQGNGNYVQDAVDQNGRIYRWVSPDENNLPQGKYEPIIPLQAPAQKQMISTNLSYKLNKSGEFKTEIALSNVDQNRISNLDDNDNLAFAFLGSYRQEYKLGKSERLWKASSFIQFEFSQDNFSPLNPYRNAEFKRDWIVENEYAQNENAGTAILTLQHGQDFESKYIFNSFIQQNKYQGFRHTFNALFNRSGYKADVRLNMLSSKSTLNDATFIRPKIELSKVFKKINDWQVGINYESENKRIVDASDLQLNPESNNYFQYRTFISSPANDLYNVNLSYQYRQDNGIAMNQFAKANHASDVVLSGFWNTKTKVSNLNWQFTIRDLVIDDELISNLEPQRSYLGKLQHALKIKQGFINSNVLYELGAGQEPTLEFEYQEVPIGEGNYIYTDDNADGIQQIWEFKPAIFAGEGNYIKRRIFTNKYLRTNQSIFNWSVRTNVAKIIKDKEGIGKFLSKISVVNSFRVNNRNASNQNFNWLVPFQYELLDSNQIALDANLRNTLYFNRNSPVYDIQIGQFKNQRKQQLSSGFTIQQNEEYFIRTRWNIHQKLTWTPSLNYNASENENELFTFNNFKIKEWEFKHTLSYLHSSALRFNLKYEFSNGLNDNSSSMESAIKHNIAIQSTVKPKDNSAYHASFSFVNIDFDGQSNSNIEYHLLNGLKNGQNYLWNLSLDRHIGQNLILRITYSGRKTGENMPIHQGNAQIRASF